MEFDHSTDTIIPDDQAVITIGGTGGLVLSPGTTGQRPGSAPVGTARWNLDLDTIEVFSGESAWVVSGSLSTMGPVGRFKAVTTNQTAGDPGAGKVRWNNATLTSSTQIYVDSVSDSGVDATAYFNKLKPGTILYIQSAADSAKFQRWEVTSITNNSGWFTFVVTLIDSAGVIGNNSNIALTFNFNGSATTGTVTSVGVSSNGTYASAITVGATPVTTSGTITLTPNVFGTSTPGIVPQSGGGTTNFLRADGTWATPTASATPAGNTKEVQYNNAGVAGGATNVEIDNGDLCLLVNASPVTPPADNVKLFGKKMAQRMMPAAVGPSAMDAALQPATWRQKIGIWTPPGNANTVPGVVGTTAWTAVGTATARNVATTNLLTRMRRLGYVSATTAGSLTSIRTAAAQYTTGTGSGIGGLFASFRFAITDAAAVSGARFFVGFSSTTTAPTNVEPSTLTNAFGVAQLSTSSTQLYFVYGGSAAQTAIALGTSFPPMNGTGIANGVPYDLTLFCPPNSNGVVHYELFRLDTNTSIAGTITPGTPGTQTPANTTLLNPVMWRCNNTTAAAVGMDLCNFYIETDY